MRHLDKNYPYTKPSKNRSSKNLNMILGKTAVFPAYLNWSIEQLQKFASRCKNKKSNCYLDAINLKKKLAAENAATKAAKKADKDKPAKSK